MKKLKLLGVLVAVLLLLAPSMASAAGYAGVGGKPSHPKANNPRTKSIFIYSLKPGQQASDGVTIFNSTAKQQTISVYAVDSVLSSGGSFACAQDSQARTDVGSWIKLQTSSITLASGGSKVVPFTVTIPQKVDVGEHDGCIAIQAKSATKSTDKSGVLLSFRSAIRVVVTMPGKIVKQLKLTAVNVSKTKDGSYTVSPVAQNEGNVSLDTDVKVKVNSLLGWSAGSQHGTYPVLPRSKASWNFQVKHPFWGGWYRAHAKATYNSNPTAELGVNKGASKTATLSSAVFFAAPSLVGGLIELVILLIIIAIVALYVKKQRNVRHIRHNWEDYKVKKNDDLSSIAKQRHTSWRKLARVNSIKAPYHLSKDQVLKVPPKRED